VRVRALEGSRGALQGPLMALLGSLKGLIPTIGGLWKPYNWRPFGDLIIGGPKALRLLRALERPFRLFENLHKAIIGS
jgi:hypothetical protein